MFSGEFDMGDAEIDCYDKKDPVCPYCKSVIPIDWDYDHENARLDYDGVEWERTCKSCGKNYPVQTNVTETFTTVKYDEDGEV